MAPSAVTGVHVAAREAKEEDGRMDEQTNESGLNVPSSLSFHTVTRVLIEQTKSLCAAAATAVVVVCFAAACHLHFKEPPLTPGVLSQTTQTARAH